MSKLVGVLFPWGRTFKRLELKERWWHRLAVVLFSIALIPSFLFSWVIGNEANVPIHSFDQDIHYWGPNGVPTGIELDLNSVQPLGNASPTQTAQTPSQRSASVPSSLAGLTFGSSPPAPPLPTIQKTIEMPDGKTATYSGNTSDEAIKAEWKHKLKIATAKAALLGFGVAVLVTVVFSYLLQASYRALLYVIYGANGGATPDNPAG
jgi:hypothetical protein